MRRFLCLSILLIVTVSASAQIKEPPKRFGLRLDVDLYSQSSPKQTLTAVLRALEKDRYDYLIAHLLDPVYVDEQLAISYPVFEKQARALVEKEGLDRKGFSRQFIVDRIRFLATQSNFEHLVRRIRSKIDDDPESVRDLKRMLREGEFLDAADTSVGKLKDVKDRAIYFRRVGDRWFMENKMQE